MYRLEDVEEKVWKFIHDEFPEIESDLKNTGFVEEVAATLFECLTGDEENAHAGGTG